MKSVWNRRGFLGAAVASVSSLFAPRRLFAKANSSAAGAAVAGFGQSGNPYDELGVTTVINCQGTMTMLGGSVIRPELEPVMAMAGRHFVSIPDLGIGGGEGKPGLSMCSFMLQPGEDKIVAQQLSNILNAHSA